VDRVGDRNLPDLMVTNWLPSVGTPGPAPWATSRFWCGPCSTTAPN